LAASNSEMRRLLRSPGTGAGDRRAGADEAPAVTIVAHAVHDGGGMERTLAELVRRIHHDHRVTIVSSELADDLRPLVTWRRVPTPRKPFPVRFVSFFVLGGLVLAREGRRRRGITHTMGAIVPNRVDVAGVHFCHAGFQQANGRVAAGGLASLRGVNTTVTNVLSRWAERWCYRSGRVRVLATVSRGVERELRAAYPNVPVVITPNGVDGPRFRPDRDARRELRAAESVGADDVVALFVGGDWERKGLAIAIEGVALAVAAGAPVRLWVVGPGDEERMRSLAASHGVADRVHLFGRRADAERWFRAADVFVLPTAYEAFPLVGLEAAAAGLPIVATAVNGFEDLVRDDAGVLVERDAPAVGRALQRLADDAGLRARLGATAHERSLEYTWERSVDAVTEVYAALGGGPPRGDGQDAPERALVGGER
jgi:glycosyltransferase involved in cell wall biosynthesis